MAPTYRRVRVKICGITSLHDALAATEAGADALGFVFAPSPRQVTPAQAAAIIRELPPFVTVVGLLVDQDPAPILAQCPLDVLQFHGTESPETVANAPRRAYKAFRIRSVDDLDELPRYLGASAWLLDAYVPGVAGGTGCSFPWELAGKAAGLGRPVVVAGGLNPENVEECVRTTRPWAVDVSSGVERAPGVKDPARMRDFVAAARSVELAPSGELG